MSSCGYFLQSGGAYVAGIFDRDTCTLHRTFHSYTVRAGQGFSQSAQDGSGKHAKSAGANLRRYNELLYKEVS